MTGKPDSREPLGPEQQRKALEEAERNANAKQPRNFKDDALTDKQVHVEPDGTGPTSTGSFDTDEDREHGSGNDTDAPPAEERDQKERAPGSIKHSSR